METVQREEYNEQGKELREHGSAAFPIAWYSGAGSCIPRA